METLIVAVGNSEPTIGGDIGFGDNGTIRVELKRKTTIGVNTAAD